MSSHSQTPISIGHAKKEKEKEKKNSYTNLNPTPPEPISSQPKAKFSKKNLRFR